MPNNAPERTTSPFMAGKAVELLGQAQTQIFGVPSQSKLTEKPVPDDSLRAQALVDTGSIRGFQITDSLAKALGLTLQGTGQRTQRYQGQGDAGAATAKALKIHFSARLEEKLRPGLW